LRVAALLLCGIAVCTRRTASLIRSPTHPFSNEAFMELSSLVNVLNSPFMDEFLIWAVAAVAGTVGVVALVNALDMFLDAETETN